MWDSRVVLAFLPPLREDATWAHPLIAGSGDRTLRADLHTLAERAPAMLDALDRLPQLTGHGDACPQNLLVPADDPDGFVAIDWAMMGPGPVGSDLAQLLVGLAHAGDLPPDQIPGLAEALVGPFADGLAAEGRAFEEETIRYAFAATTAIRSAFTALALERLTEPVTEELAELFASRLRLTRALVDLGLGLPFPP
jgi:Ser/Thr protein kinase RdoA (MazF antagonist)